MPLNSWRLQMLSELANRGTIRAVAEALQLSPSSVSQQLSVLENETGTQLLVRVGRRVRITPAGELLVVHAREILDQMEAAQAELDGLTTHPAGLVRLAAFPSSMPRLIIPLAEQLRRAFPAVQLEIHELEPDRTIPALQRGDVDVALTAHPAEQRLVADPALAVESLMVDPIVLVLSADRPDDASSDISVLGDEWWALDRPGTHLADLTVNACRTAGFEPQIAGYFPSYDVLLRHVEAGLSVALLPALAVDDRYRVRAHEPKPSMQRHIVVASRRGARSLAAVQAVLEILHSISDAVSSP